MTAFLENYPTRGRSGGSLNMYRTKCGHIVRIFGAQEKLANVTAVSVDGYVAKRLDEGAARSTIGKELTALRQVLKLAKRRGMYGADLEAVMPFGFSTESEPRTRSLTWEEFAALVPEVAKYSPAHAGMVVFFVATACRKSEAERARGEDIDWRNWTVRVRGTKTRLADDEVPIAEPFQAMLARWVPESTGELWGVWHNMTRDLAAACKRAGIERVTANDLRRSNATLLRRAGASVDVVARMLRHSDSRMVERVYGRITATDAGRLLAGQLSALPSKISTVGAPQDPKARCPGTESNCRHEDFQSTSQYEEPSIPGAFCARVPCSRGLDPALLAYSLSTVALATGGTS